MGYRGHYAGFLRNPRLDLKSGLAHILLAVVQWHLVIWFDRDPKRFYGMARESTDPVARHLAHLL